MEVGSAVRVMHVGCAVRVVGLASKRASAYNSRIGKIIELDGERATLLLDDGETLPLRSRNLEALSAEESAAFAAKEAKAAKLVAEKKDAEDAKAAKEEAAAKELAEKEKKPPPPPPAAADDSIGFHNIGDIVDEIVLEQNKEIEEKLETSRSRRSSMVDVTDAPTPAPAPTPKPKKKSSGGLDFGNMFSKPGALSAREPDVVWRSVGGERPRVFFDLSVGGQPAGRVVFELFPDSAPKSAENFRCLCTGEKGVSRHSRRKLSYQGCAFHALASGMALFGGDISAKNNGKGGESIYASGDYEDRSGLLEGAPKHDRPGILSMGNPHDKPPGYDAQEFMEAQQAAKKGERPWPRDWPSFGSRFAVYLQPEPEGLDGKHPVVGIVVEGLDVLKEVSAVAVDDGKNKAPGTWRNRPIRPVVIAECGQLGGVGAQKT